jgi:replicative DNA helicase
MERELLGAILLDNRHYEEAAEGLDAMDFSLTSHGDIFRAIGALLDSGRSVDPLVLQHDRGQSWIERVGGMGYLLDLSQGLVRNRRGVAEYVRAIRQGAVKRRLSAGVERWQAAAADPLSQPDVVLAEIEAEVLELRAGAVEDEGTLVGAAVDPLLERMRRERTRSSELLGLPTGLQTLDAATCGMQPGENTTIGARSGVGKSSLMLQAAMENCKAGRARDAVLARDEPRADPAQDLLCTFRSAVPEGARSSRDDGW